MLTFHDLDNITQPVTLCVKGIRYDPVNPNWSTPVARSEITAHVTFMPGSSKTLGQCEEFMYVFNRLDAVELFKIQTQKAIDDLQEKMATASRVAKTCTLNLAADIAMVRILPKLTKSE
jgi:hypothetical protein